MSRKSGIEVIIDTGLEFFKFASKQNPILGFVATIVFYLIGIYLNKKIEWFGFLLYYMCLFLAIGSFIAAIVAIFRKNKVDMEIDKNFINNMGWKEFEDLISDYYRKQGYYVTETGRNYSDGGIDLIAEKEGYKIIVQCKHWKAYKIDVKVVREIYGLLVSENASKAVVITSGDFTQPAIDFAKDKPIELIDGKKLLSLIYEVKKSKQTNTSVNKPVNTISSSSTSNQKLNNLSSSENQQKLSDDLKYMPPDLKEKYLKEKPPMCPYCNVPLVLKVATKGKHQGEKFWACPNYPKCTYIQAYKS